MIVKFACVAAALTVASVGQAHAGGLLGILSGNSNKNSALIVVSPSIDLGVSGILSNNGILNGNKTGILNGVLNGNKTSVDVIDNNDNGKKKRRH
ncbi:hypothetical protein [Agrobacterium tumefaciens]|uniref:hypothetical protein n=1 Tax=Agrobacterium tumefaciens TaxID=358 RepID=UPI00287E0965|nr:hypothetical protein [Agrobacterium tumefaciens]MDS7595495.1 hypothetical protein [Agrobacterium tumefaciens]